MNPQSMQFAMEQMRRMSPDQLSQLAQQMNHLSPDTIQAAMAQMQNMRPEDWEQARHKMSGMRPEDMSSAATQASAHYQAQQEYIVKASVQLKNEGNRLHQQSQYAEAVPKYEKALTNLAEYKSPAAQDVVKACCLNLASCYLQLGQYKECVEKCNAVLAGDADNLKALYRRGQALLKLQKGQEAVDDLQRAVKLSNHDPNQQGLIKTKLQEAKDLAWQQRTSGGTTAEGTVIEEVEGVIIEEVDDEEENDKPSTTPPTTTSSSSQPTSTTSTTTSQPAFPATFPGALPSSMDPSMVNQAVQMMKSNPDLLKQVEQQMEHMTPAEMAALSAQVGMPVTKEMLSTAKERMSNLTPDQLESMAKLAQTGGVPLANGTGPAGMKPEDVKKMADAVASNPDMMRQASEMIASMTPEQLETMAKSTGTSVEMARLAAEQMRNMDPEQLQVMARMASGAAASSSRATPAATTAATSRSVSSKSTDNTTSTVAPPMPIPDLSNMPPMEGPNGMTITPEMANMMSKMMAEMTPEQMSEMTKAAMSMGSMFQGGAAGAAGPGGPGMEGMPNISPEMIAQLSRPEMMDQVMGMMRSMDKDTLVKMLMTNGMCPNEDMAKHMADQMQSMSDTQMKLMVRAASTLQRTMQAAQSAKQYLLRNKLMLVALVLLIVAVLLRVFGIM